MISLFYLLNILLLAAGFIAVRLSTGERRFSLSLVLVLAGVMVLAGEYLYVPNHFRALAVNQLLFSECVLAILLVTLAIRTQPTMLTASSPLAGRSFVEASAAVVIAVISGYFLYFSAGTSMNDGNLRFEKFTPVYITTIFLLVAAIYTAWRLEQFWRALKAALRWEYKFLIIGCYLICGALAWAASYRLTYLVIVPKHLSLLAALLTMGWVMMAYAVANHKLLNRKFFVSRKVVYSFLIPTLLSAYLLGFGIVSVVMLTFGIKLTFVLKWLLVVTGLVMVAGVAFSEKIRKRVQFFISTHFYVNKYEYRDEWLSLSQKLQGARSEADVIGAMRNVLEESLYTSQIYIWLGDQAERYRLLSSTGRARPVGDMHTLTGDDPLVEYLRSQPFFYLDEKDTELQHEKIVVHHTELFNTLELKLFAPLRVNNQLAGLIGLGAEYTGGEYGHDDFDLLSVIGSQVASALLSVRMAEKLANARERQAWSRLSAFVLHDIKNAATMLSLMRENSTDHIHEPEFQQDMLEVVDDALRRMTLVEQRLRTLKEDIQPDIQSVDFQEFLTTNCRYLRKKLPMLNIEVDCPENIQLQTDSKLLSSILENLVLNAYEAKPEAAKVIVRCFAREEYVQLELTDNGPGIAEDLLPDALFEPFKTSKVKGSGIGLWQVAMQVSALNSVIQAANAPHGGACFTLRIPLEMETANI